MAKFANCYGNQNSSKLKPCLVNITNDSCNVPSGEFESSSYGFCPLKWYVINKFADHVVTEVSKVLQNFPETDVKAIWLTNNSKSTDFQQMKSNTVPSL